MSTIKIPPHPCLSQAAIDHFESILRPDFRIFELGAGGSTLWLARRAAQVVSVEHDREWYEAVEAAIISEDLANVDLRYRPLQPEDKLNPWKDYSIEILQFNNDFFDLAFVDGWDPARLPCAAYAQGKVKPGGYVVVDDTNQPYLQAVFGILQGWARHDVTGRILGRIDGAIVDNQTTFFRKPEL